MNPENRSCAWLGKQAERREEGQRSRRGRKGRELIHRYCAGCCVYVIVAFKTHCPPGRRSPFLHTGKQHEITRRRSHREEEAELRRANTQVCPVSEIAGLPCTSRPATRRSVLL